MKATISLTLEVEKLSLIALIAKAVEDGKISGVTEDGVVIYSDEDTDEDTTEAPPTEDLPEKEAPNSPVEVKTDKNYKIEDLRELTMNFLKGSTENKQKVKEILSSFGVNKLPELDPGDYASYVEKIMKEVF